MALNVKVGLIGLLDMLKFANLGKKREKIIAKAPAEEITADYPVNNFAKTLHPDFQTLVVDKIIDRPAACAKTFVFRRADGKPAPYFRAGQYVSLKFPIGKSFVSRPYSISSSPKEALEGTIAVTVKRNPSGFAADWLLDHLKEGDRLFGSEGLGSFYYEKYRDAPHVVALAGGSGITPFYSMAKEIAHGKMRGCTLTILYGSVKSDDIVLKAELDKVCAECKAVKVVHVLSDDPTWQSEKGFITKELIEKYSSPDCTYMFCGPLAMFRFVSKALDEMGVAKRRFRHDVVNNPADISTLPGYPVGTEKKTFKICVVRGVREDIIEAKASESVAVALERSAIPVDTHCRNGECGFCRSQLLSGDIFVSPIGDGRREMDKEMGWFYACSSYPLSDLKIKIPIM